MGESHPAARKVTLTFTTADLAASLTPNLTQPQVLKLQKLLSTRYNPFTDKVHMSAEKFPNAAQNKRYLGDLLGTLIKECREGEDMFEDIPLDTRHVKREKMKQRYQFPVGWMMTEGRVAQLAEARQMKDGSAQMKAQNEEQRAGQAKIAAYVNAMRLGRRDPPANDLLQGSREAVREKVPEPVVVR
jgi:hypothetical protein